MPGHMQDRSLRPGYYYGVDTTGANAVGTVALNVLYMMPFTVGELARLTKIGAYVSTGIPATTARLGIYRGLRGQPTDLLLEAGAIDASVVGHKEVTIDISLSRGLYWVAIVEQGVGGVTWNTKIAVNPLLPAGNPAGGGIICAAWYMLNVSGALPAQATISGISTGGRPSVILKAE